MSPAVPVENQRFAAGKHAAAKADLRPTKWGEAVVGGEARAGKTLRKESWKSLGGKLTSWTTEARVTPEKSREAKERKREEDIRDIKNEL